MQRISTETIYDLSDRDILVLNQEVDKRKKRVGTTWLLWGFLGSVGAHYLYLGHWMTGFIRLFGLPIALVIALATGSAASGFGTSGTSGSSTGVAGGLIVFWILFSLWQIWWAVDIFLISGMLRDNERKTQEEVLQELRAMKGKPQPQAQPYYQPMQGQVPYAQPMQYQNTMPPQMPRCPTCGANIAQGVNPCPFCRNLIRW